MKVEIKTIRHTITKGTTNGIYVDNRFITETELDNLSKYDKPLTISLLKSE